MEMSCGGYPVDGLIEVVRERKIEPMLDQG